MASKVKPLAGALAGYVFLFTRVVVNAIPDYAWSADGAHRKLRAASTRPRRSMVRKAVVVAALVCLTLGLAAHPSMAAGKPSYTCPPGFVGYTLEEGLNLPRVQASIAAGIFTADQVAFIFGLVDHNGDGITCWKDVAALNGAHGHYANGYNLVDNNASVPN